MAVRIESHAEPIPGYRLIERLGGGGFGEVWKAEAPGGLHKAIKFVFGDLSSADDGSERAEQELKALSRVKSVRHPYILSLERFDIIDGQLMIVMELAERNLWDRFKECRSQGLIGIPRDELLIYMEETAEALDLMNSTYQLQHLDIKPQNIFLMFQHVKVADFGLVKDLEGMQASVTGGVTPVYAAPETFDGWVSRFCDQYSLAIVYQELLTGQRPFAGNNIRQLILQHLQAAPNLSPLPPQDQPVIGRALAKIPDQRFPMCRDMVKLLRQNSTALPPGAPIPVPPSAQGVTPPPQPLQMLEPQESCSPETANLRGMRNNDSSSGATAFIPEPECSTPLAETPPPPAEVKGEGVLFPALVIGVGQLGMNILQRLRERVVQSFGSPSQLPNLRFLLLDTDPEAVKAATRGPAAAALSVQDVFLTPLNRPSHYLKGRDGRPKIETWLDPRMLYRIPRSQVTGGVRALGRLAFLDNYRSILKRLHTELDACLNATGLTRAGKQTQLGVRSNRPRVYVLAGLAGGTGGGMFLDLTYTVRRLLRTAGYEHAEVIGLFLLPSPDGGQTPTRTLGNTYAALSELNYYAMPDNAFVAQYHEREATVLDRDPPFSRCFLLPLPKEKDVAANAETLDLAGNFLFRDLCSPLGKAADLARTCITTTPWRDPGQTYSTFGMFEVTWPRRDLLRASARRLCHQVVTRWMSRDTKPIAAAVTGWMEEQWKERELGADEFIARLRKHCTTELGQEPEDAIQAILAQNLRLVPESAKHTDGKKTSPIPPAPSIEELQTVLTRFDALLGRPQDDHPAEAPTGLLKSIRDGGAALGERWEQKVTELTVRLIEKPEFRLAGAEEAVRHAVSTIEKLLHHHEPLLKDLFKRTAEAYRRLQVLANPTTHGGKRPMLPPAEQFELLRNYPKWRFQGLMLQQVMAAFVGLRGHLSDQLREINFLRVRLTELDRMLETPPESETRSGQALSRCLFPGGCQNLEEATEQFLATFTPERLLELDNKIQEVLRRDFTALVHVCMTSKNMLKDVEKALIETAMTFAGTMLAEANVADILRQQYPEPEQLAAELTSCYTEAVPELGDHSTDASHLVLMALPSGSGGDALMSVMNQALPDAELNVAVSHDDLILYREVTGLPLVELDYLGQAAQDAYRQMASTEHFTPHTRSDVEFEPLVK